MSFVDDRAKLQDAPNPYYLDYNWIGVELGVLVPPDEFVHGSSVLPIKEN